MTIECSVERLETFIDRGQLIQGKWGDAQQTACMMSALAGATSDKECAAKGWPLWLSELGHTLFDQWPKSKCAKNALRFGRAVNHYASTSGDWDRAFRDIRLRSVLPIALEAVGEGDEPWRIECRESVQWSIDNDGSANPKSAVVAFAATAARAASTAGAFGAAEAAGAAGQAAEAAAYAQITETVFEVLEAGQ